MTGRPSRRSLPSRVRLETPTLERLEEFVALVRRSAPLHRSWVSPPGTGEAYLRFLLRLEDERRRAFFVCVRDGGALAGVVEVSEIVLGAFRSAYLGYYGFAPTAGRGYMTEGLALVLGTAFGPMRLHRVEANIQPGNLSSIALVKRLGFRLEGYSPRYLKIAGRWRDHERWAILAEEWRDRRGRTGGKLPLGAGRTPEAT